jgi:hypothetical protein
MLRSFTVLKPNGEVAVRRFFSMSLLKPMSPFSKSSGRDCRICPNVEVDEAHGEHVVGEEGELILPVRVVGLEGVPQESDVLLLAGCLEGERQVVV